VIAADGEDPEAAQQVEVAPVIAVIEILALAALEPDVESDRPQHAHELLVEMARVKDVALGLARSKGPWDVQISTRHSHILLLCYLANPCIIFWYNEKCDDFPLDSKRLSRNRRK
jgi:hypothetical protein